MVADGSGESEAKLVGHAHGVYRPWIAMSGDAAAMGGMQASSRFDPIA